MSHSDPSLRTIFLEALVFTPDGKRVATCSNDAAAKLWDIQTQREITTGSTRTLNNFGSIAVAPDGQRFAAEAFAGKENELVYLWNPATGRRVATLKAGPAPEWNALAFVPPDGSTLMSVSDREIHVWRAPTLAEIEAAERK